MPPLGMTKCIPMPMRDASSNWVNRTVAFFIPPPILESVSVTHDFTVHGMTCKNCVIAITDAVMKADPAAAVSIDLGRQHVVIESDLSRHKLTEVILDEGFVVA